METIKTVHLISVILFLVHYLIKTGMLLGNAGVLDKYSKSTRIPEMIISLAFLGTGGYLLLELPEINKMMIIKLCMVFASIPIAIVGFKKKKKILAVLAVLLIIGSYGIAEMSRAKREKGVETTSLDGKEIYSSKCVVCHDADGKNSTTAKDLSISAMDYNQIIEIITNGKEGTTMKGFKEPLTPDQIVAVAKYVEGLKQ